MKISKTKTIVILATAMFAVSGCNDNGFTGIQNTISNKPYVVILQGVPGGICETNDYKQRLRDKGFINPITQEVNGLAHCRDYGKMNDGEVCKEGRYNGDGATYGANLKSCTIGFDGLEGYNKNAKLYNEESNLDEDILDINDITETTFISINQ